MSDEQHPTITEDHLLNVCRLLPVCRYLMMSPSGFICTKNDPDLRMEMDIRVKNNTIRATGDNCKGL